MVKEICGKSRPKIDQTAFETRQRSRLSGAKSAAGEKFAERSRGKDEITWYQSITGCISDHLVGAVEGKHPERKAAGFGHDPETALVREIMVKKAFYCFENQSVDEAREIMCEHHLDYLPVVDDDMRVMGIVALRDLAGKENASD
jgi:CBS domain-containing protein